MGMEKIVLDTNSLIQCISSGLDIIGLDDFLAHLKNNPNP